jgi:hypothetical protein
LFTGREAKNRKVPEAPKKLPPFSFRTWDLGVEQPPTREDIHEDVEIHVDHHDS